MHYIYNLKKRLGYKLLLVNVLERGNITKIAMSHKLDPLSRRFEKDS